MYSNGTQPCGSQVRPTRTARNIPVTSKVHTVQRCCAVCVGRDRLLFQSRLAGCPRVALLPTLPRCRQRGARAYRTQLRHVHVLCVSCRRPNPNFFTFISTTSNYWLRCNRPVGNWSTIGAMDKSERGQLAQLGICGVAILMPPLAVRFSK